MLIIYTLYTIIIDIYKVKNINISISFTLFSLLLFQLIALYYE